MLKGYEDRTRDRRMLFYSEGYFSTTIEGLVAFEANFVSLSWVLSGQKDNAYRMLIPPPSRSLFLRFGIGAIKTAYKLAKFTLK